MVDDVAEQRELAASMLTRLGYRVEAVSGGEEALAFLRSTQDGSGGAGHDHGPGDGRSGDVPADRRDPPGAEGDHRKRVFGDGPGEGGPGLGGRGLCAQALRPGKDRRGDPE